MRTLMIVMVASVMAGCANMPGQAPVNMTEDQVVASETSLSTGIAAADGLLHDGETLRQQGKYANAANNFERGIRMAPRSPALYLALAKTRLAMKDYNNANQMASRALSLLPKDARGAEKTAKAEAWIVIAQARENSGDQKGAAAARARAQDAW